MSQPSFDVLFHEGVRLMQAGDSVSAQQAFRAALLLAPHVAAAHVNLGLLLTQEGNWMEAEHHYRTALGLDPGQYQAWLHYGALLAACKRFAESEAAYRHALALAPTAPGVLSNLGVLLACTKRETEAEACYRAALALDPQYKNASFNLAYLLLRQGRFDEGWAAFESRDWYARFAQHFAFPRWHGEALEGKRLMIAFEAGHGDMIQFCRYAGVARQLGAAQIAIVCHPALATLFTRLEGVDTVYGFDEDVPQTGWDYWTPPMSFPFMLGTRLDTQLRTIPAKVPYLQADPDKTARLAPALASSSLRVGLVWQGNPRFENDADRSLPSVDVLAPLLAVEGVQFFSLQKGTGQLDGTGPASLIDLAPHIASFDDTAALLASLDLIITVDTAVAHLAGAMDRPCWVLLPDYKTDWRWMKKRTDTPWYPGMRLFRQRAGGGWPDVILDVADALRLMLAQDRSPA